MNHDYNTTFTTIPPPSSASNNSYDDYDYDDANNTVVPWWTRLSIHFLLFVCVSGICFMCRIKFCPPTAFYDNNNDGHTVGCSLEDDDDRADGSEEDENGDNNDNDDGMEEDESHTPPAEIAVTEQA